VTSVRLPKRLAQTVDLALAPEQHFRECEHLALELTEAGITGFNGRINLCAPVAEESPPEATHGAAS
jgi:hypothetical protein